MAVGTAWGQSAVVVQPSTISTYAGGPTSAPAAVGAGKLCNGGGAPGTGNTLPVATDAVNDGCPAAQAIFSTDNRGGLTADPLGNVFVLDGGNGGNNLLRKIDARSGLISLVAGGATTNCAGAVDKEGDGCPLANAGNFNNPRGVGSDPFGNITIAGYSDGLVHVVCNAVSPLCSAAQVGTMRVGAGCTTTATAYGSSGSGADNILATPTGTCSTSVAEINQPRGAGADAFGNILIGETGATRYRIVLGPQTYNGVTNPLWAVIALNPAYTAAQGRIYTVDSGTTAFTAGARCNGTSGGSATGPVAIDTIGDGCPFYQAKLGTGGGSLQAIVADANGNIFFYDYTNSPIVRVLYVGGTAVANAITANNTANANFTGVTAGSIYQIAGAGAVGLGLTPILGTTANFGQQIYKMTIDARTGNLFLANSPSGGAVSMFDIATGFVHKIAASAGNCSVSATGVAPNAAGDGCPATNATFNNANGMGIALDNLGNLYLSDSTSLSIRRISADSYTSVAAGSVYTPNLLVHSQPAAGSTSPTPGPSTDFTVGSPTCVTNSSTGSPAGDNTIDCASTVTFTPKGVGLRTAPVAIVPTTGTTVNAALTGTGTGSALVFDPASPALPSIATVGAMTIPAGLAIDGAGNVFTAGTLNGSLAVTETTGGTSSTIFTPTVTPTQIAVDPQGNVYAALGTGNIGKLVFTAPSTFATSNITNAAIANVKAIAVDPNQNVYVADSTNQVIRFSQTTGQALTLTATALNNPVALALDTQGNVLIADAGAGTIYKLPVGGITSGLPAVVLSGINPVAVAGDAAGDIYYLDSSTKNAVMIPVSGATATVLTGLKTPNAIAVDGLGNVYISDAGTAGVTKVNRSQYSFAFPSTSATLAGTITNTGNTAATGFNQGDPADFQLAGSGATCVPGTSSILPGAACTINASFTPQGLGGGTLTNIVSLKPTATTFGALTLSGTVAGNAVTTTTAIGGQTPVNPVYVATGTEETFTVTVTASSGNPTGSVNVSIDGAAATAYALTSGSGTTSTATVTLSGLIAANHTIAATYPTTGAYTGSSTSSATNFTIASATTAITWTPSTTTQQFSAAIGTGVFDAYAASGSTVIPGAFVYTATPSGGSATMVDASTYLPIGSYTLAVTFTPTDAVDYTGSTKTLGSTYIVTRATTTAGIGASQFVVAADGTGNYTSVESAVSALPVTGGNIYIAPGTYAGQTLVAYPNVGLHGLGGNAANVVLTSETGAFGGANPSLGIAANPFGFNNDEASATLVVAKGTISGTSYTPSNFYMDNLSLINTYDTDTANTNAITGSNQSCTAVTSSSNNSLYNAGTLCASQALTLWITADKSVLNNVRMTSLQDTLAAYNTTGSNSCSGIACSSRQYYWKNYITGDIDYVFGDAAAVFDQTSFYTTYHNGSNTGNATVFAQNKSQQTGSSGDYLSGYVANNSTFTSQMTPLGAMTALNYGRPYGVYSTTALINNSVDDVVPAGWESFSGANLATATYIEFGTTGAGAATIGSRETTSVQPSVATSAAQIAKYLPVTFLSSPAPDVWNPAAALATGVNGYVPAATTGTINYGQSVTILARPQTPGGGAIPTGTYTVSDNATQIASGSLDASGAMYLTQSTFAVGTHSLTMTYAGDANFSGYTTTATPFVLTVNGISTSTTVAVTTSSPVYGQSVTVTATVGASSGSTPTGSVSLTVDNGTAMSGTLSNGVATFSLPGLSAGSHSLSAMYTGAGADTTSTGTGSVTLAKAVLTVLATSGQRAYGGNTFLPYTISGFVNNDPPTVVTGAATVSTTALPNSPAGTYPITPALGTLSAANYTFTFSGGTLVVHGGVAQTITLLKLPNLPHGITVPLYGQSTSGLPLTYTVSGPATVVNGTSLQITGTGTVTVTASQSGNATFNAATSVSRSFTAQ